MTLQGRAFFEAKPVEIRWNGVEGPVLATPSGPEFSVDVRIPDAPPGTYTIVAVAYLFPDLPFQAAVPFTVTPRPASISGGPRSNRGAAPNFYGLPAAAVPLAAFADCPLLSANVIRGSTTANKLFGTERGDRIFAGTGNDLVEALAGDDCVNLGAGDDRGGGGPGADLILGEAGVDRLRGSAGGDRLRGGPQSDRISAGSGDDRALGNQGNDRVSGGAGDDRLEGGAGRDRLTGGGGGDTVFGGAGGDRIRVRDGRVDRISCGRGLDRVLVDRSDRISGDCEQIKGRPE